MRANVLSSLSHQSPLLSTLQNKLHIHCLEDWYDVPISHVRKLASGKLRHAYATTEALVRAEIPRHSWDTNRFIKHTGRRVLNTPQIFLRRVIQTLFPDMEVTSNVRKDHGVVGESGHFLEIDVYVPKLKIGFEYQDPHHYFPANFSSTLGEYQARDVLKKKRMKENGITIVTIPFWWNWELDSLIATIKKEKASATKFIYEPALLSASKDAQPFSDVPPPEIANQWNFEIPDLGSPMLAHYLPTNKSFDPKNWLVFEKYDGVRAVWHPQKREFFTRWGRELPLPNFVSDVMPSLLWLDGEVWFGRERHTRYQALKLSAGKKQSEGGVWAMGIEWEKLKYVVFDSPTPLVSDLPYLERYNFLRQIIPLDNPVVFFPPYEICTGRDSLESIFFRIRSQEGEGIIIRDPSAPYQHGYSKSMYKHRGYLDAEAMVLEKKSETAFLCRVPRLVLAHNTPNEGEAQTSENSSHEVEMIVDPDLFVGDTSNIETGTFVSFRYSGEQRRTGPPMNPRMYCIRPDIQSWHQLVKSKIRKAPDHQQIWTPNISTNDWSDPKNRKAFFDDFAASRNFSPLVAENWYSISGLEIHNIKGGLGLLKRYSNSFISALVDTYPNVEFDVGNFKHIPLNYWSEQENCRRFFDVFARENNFDPLVPQNWYSAKRDAILKKKGGKSVLQHHKTHMDALMNAYPFIGLDPLKFKTVPQSHWELKENRKQFFDSFAATHGFEPAVPENWKNTDLSSLTEKAGAAQVLAHFNKSLMHALADAYDNPSFLRQRKSPASY